MDEFDSHTQNEAIYVEMSKEEQTLLSKTTSHYVSATTNKQLKSHFHFLSSFQLLLTLANNKPSPADGKELFKKGKDIILSFIRALETLVVFILIVE